VGGQQAETLGNTSRVYSRCVLAVSEEKTRKAEALRVLSAHGWSELPGEPSDKNRLTNASERSKKTDPKCDVSCVGSLFGRWVEVEN